MKSNAANLPWQASGLVLLLLLGGLLVAGLADDQPEPAAAAGSSDGQDASAELQRILTSITRLRTENARLKEENSRLRKENQQLRRLLADKPEAGGGAPAPGGASNETTPQAVGATGAAEAKSTRWLTTADGQRHNNRCRFFQSGEGRTCGPDEGKPCKVCGG